MAQFDAESIWVYQAYRPSIARYAVDHQRFGGDFSFARMSWIKPNFLWMMYRSGWAAKEGQEHILAVRLKRSFFDTLLEEAVASTFDAARYPSHEAWKNAVASSEVRLQWDPDHAPQGRCLERRALQLGLRGGMLHRYGNDDLIKIEDITAFVITQRALLVSSSLSGLITPVERAYLPNSDAAMASIGLEVA
jgi:Domain of unknown function (DUF4291)